MILSDCPGNYYTIAPPGVVYGAAGEGKHFEAVSKNLSVSLLLVILCKLRGRVL